MDADGNTVRYVDMYPDFESAGHVRQTANIHQVPNRPSGFIDADAAALLEAKLNQNTWHHHEDGRRMQEIDRMIHRHFRHLGNIGSDNQRKRRHG